MNRPAAWLALASVSMVWSSAEVSAHEAPTADAADCQPSATTAPATDDRLLAGFQSTYVWQRKPGFSAPYSGINSLSTAAETGYTLSATLYLGARPWRNTEVFVNPEVIQAINISQLHGLGGMSNSENQKGGGQTPTLYLARAFVRQTFSLDGDSTVIDRGPNQFGGSVGRRRLVFTVGNMPVIDVFDVVSYAHDGRSQFLNWALLAHGAFDFAADTRGYTWGLAVEYYHDDWAFRLGRYLVPKQSNGLAIDFNPFTQYGDNLEIEHAHTLRGRPGRLRVLAFRNREPMGAFADALNSPSATGPDVALVRRNQAKLGVGLSTEQSLHPCIGAFLRASYNDGRTETYSFAEIERSLAIGLAMHGQLWRRPADSFGLAWIGNGLSKEHQRYLAAGGLGFIIGDGQLNYRPEQIIETYYAGALFPGLWLSLDFQHVENPAYNADRGRVNFFGVRMHIEI
jgi:high affinity Mn2+ porin